MGNTFTPALGLNQPKLHPRSQPDAKHVTYNLGVFMIHGHGIQIPARDTILFKLLECWSDEALVRPKKEMDEEECQQRIRNQKDLKRHALRKNERIRTTLTEKAARATWVHGLFVVCVDLKKLIEEEARVWLRNNRNWRLTSTYWISLPSPNLDQIPSKWNRLHRKEILFEELTFLDFKKDKKCIFDKTSDNIGLHTLFRSSI